MASSSRPSLDLSALRRALEQHGQEHLLQFWDELDAAGRERLAGQLAEIDWEQIASLISERDEGAPDFAALAERAEAPPSVRADGSGASWSADEAIDRGEAALRAGRLGVVIVAGGQGTRLGFDQPKGMFPIGPVSGRTLFQMLADRLRAVARRYGVRIPLYLMTSPATHDDTVAHLEAVDYLGLDRADVRIFCQGTMPAVDRLSGKLLLGDKGSLALSPDGHGGTVAALARSGSLRDAADRGIDQLFYAQVDNPLVPLCDPALIGHHLMAQSQMTTQVVRKRYPTEKVGNVVLVDDRVRIIEYSDLPDGAAERTEPDGSLKLWAGNIAVHLLDLEFLREVSEHPERLPFHRAVKKVPFVDANGRPVEPEEPNAIKFERFIFDLLPEAENAFVVEGLAPEVFAPVKNADGAPSDTPQSAREAIVALHRRWITEAGSAVAEGVQVEINPLFALDVPQLREKLPGGTSIEADRYFAPDEPAPPEKLATPY